MKKKKILNSLNIQRYTEIIEFIVLVYLFLFDSNDLGYHFFVSNVEILYVKSLKQAQRCELKQIDIVFLECDFKLPMVSEYPVNQHIKIC